MGASNESREARGMRREGLKSKGAEGLGSRGAEGQRREGMIADRSWLIGQFSARP